MPEHFDETKVFLDALFANKSLIKASVGNEQVRSTDDVRKKVQTLEDWESLTVTIEVIEAEVPHTTEIYIVDGEIGYANPCQFFDEIEEVVKTAQDEFYKNEPKSNPESEI